MDKHSDEIELKDILIKLSEYKLFIFQKKFTILLFSILFSSIGIIFTAVSDVEYQADLTFVVESSSGGSSLGSMSGIASQFGFDIGGSENVTFSQNNVLELLKSRGVITNTLMQDVTIDGKKELLIEYYIKINNLKEDWENTALEDISFNDNLSLLHDSITRIIWEDIIDNNLTINLHSDNSDIITLSYVSVNDKFAKEFVENLIAQMSLMYIKHQTSKANHTLDFLQERADSVFEELVVSEQELARVKDINQRIIKSSGRLKEMQLFRSVQVLNTMYLEIIKNRELSKITLLNSTPIINIIDQPILPLEETNISEILAGLIGFVLGGFLSLSYFVFLKIFNDALSE